jgi:predicted transcriptional regulator
MKKRTLLIRVETDDQWKKRVLETAKRIDRGLPPEEPVARLTFVNQATFLRNLYPKRLQLAMFIRRNGPMSIRELATKLQRDYKNVHTDVQMMIRLGLVKTNRDKLVHVPWDDVIIELALAA